MWSHFLVNSASIVWSLITASFCCMSLELRHEIAQRLCEPRCVGSRDAAWRSQAAGLLLLPLARQATLLSSKPSPPDSQSIVVSSTAHHHSRSFYSP